MVLKCHRDINREAISGNRLYPVIMIERADGINRFLIVDDCRSLVWKYIDNFEIVGKRVDYYEEYHNNQGTRQYIHIDLMGQDFFTNYYMENIDSVITSSQLDDVLISILSSDLTISDLVGNLDVIGYKDENVDLILKAFFTKADVTDVINFAKQIYNKTAELRGHNVQTIVENLCRYKDQEIESLFVELYTNNQFCNANSAAIIERYLEDL